MAGRAIALLSALSMAGFVGCSRRSADPAPTPTEQELASQVREYLKATAKELAVKIPLSQVRDRMFGSPLPISRRPDGRTILGGIFVVAEGELSTITVNGYPVLQVWTLLPLSPFWYQPTLVDGETGYAYHAFCTSFAPVTVAEFHGPHVPPEHLRWRQPPAP